MFPKLILSFLVALLLVTGCAENRASFFVQDMKVPTDECVIPADRDATYYSWGTWDIGIRSNYYVHPLVINEMTSSVRLNPNSAESNLIQVEGAWVSLLDTSDNELIDEFFIYAPATVNPEGGSTAMNFPVVDSELYNYLAGAYSGILLDSSVLCGSRTTSNIVARVRIKGVTSGNKDIDTPYFFFPITVCCGCLVYYPPDAWDAATGMHLCLDVEGSTETDVPCFAGQDKDIDCRVCAGNSPPLCAPSSDLFINPWYD